MSVRKHYVEMPTDYVQELKNSGNRSKAIAFMDYFSDVCRDDVCSQRFYAQAWNCSKTSALNWVKEFDTEIARFNDYWELKNAEQDRSGKNQGDHQVTTELPQKTATDTQTMDFENYDLPQGDHQVTKDIIITTTTQTPPQLATDGEFNIYYAELKMLAGNYVGKKEEVFTSYTRVRDFINIKVLVKAYKKYFSENRDKKTTGLKKFIDDNTYLHYLPTKRIRVTSGDKVYIGEFINEWFIRDDGLKAELPMKKFIEMLMNGEIEFVFKGVA